MLHLRRVIHLNAQGELPVSTCAWMRPWADLMPADIAVLGAADDQVCPARRPGGYYVGVGGGGGAAKACAGSRHACARAPMPRRGPGGGCLV